MMSEHLAKALTCPEFLEANEMKIQLDIPAEILEICIKYLVVNAVEAKTVQGILLDVLLDIEDDLGTVIMADRVEIQFDPVPDL